MTKTEKAELSAVVEKLDMAENTWDRNTCGEYIRQARDQLRVLVGDEVQAAEPGAGA